MQFLWSCMFIRLKMKLLSLSASQSRYVCHVLEKKLSFVLLIENIFLKFICKSSLSIPFSLTIQLIRNNHAENTILGIFEIRQSRFWVVYYKSISYESTYEKLWHFHISNPRYYKLRIIMQRTTKFKRA